MPGLFGVLQNQYGKVIVALDGIGVFQEQFSAEQEWEKRGRMAEVFLKNEANAGLICPVFADPLKEPPLLIKMENLLR